MGFFDFFRSNKNVISETLFLFNDSHVIVDQKWINELNLEGIVITLVGYVSRYYNICDDRQRSTMFEYLADIHNKKITFEADEQGDYSHKHIWYLVLSTLNESERDALGKAFDYESKAPLLYDPNIDKAFVQRNALKVYSEYRFTAKLVKSIPISYLSLGLYDKIFLPMSVSVLINKAFTLVSEAGKTLLLEALGTVCIGLAKNGLAGVDKAAEIEMINEIFQKE